jgi:plastocyanin
MRILNWLLMGAVLAAGSAIAQGDGASDGGVVEVRMVTEGQEFYFDPVGLHVEPGTTIRFINESGQHSATAYCEDNGKERRIPEGAECWDSGVLTEQGATFEVTLTEEGVYDYYCIPHEALGMVGRIIVGSVDAFPAQDPANLPPAVQQALPSAEEIMGAEDGVLPHQGGGQ